MLQALRKNRWHEPGGGAELLRLALPLIVSSSFWTLQITIDRIFLSQYSADAVAASMPAALLFWTPLTLLQNTSGYATTFVAQYLGAGRPKRVGPSVWQALYFGLAAGIGFLGLFPLASQLAAIGGHDPDVQFQEAQFFRCLCFTALPTLVTASCNAFFAGRGQTWTVLIIDSVGFGVDALLDYLLIFGRHGFPECGIVGAGIATIAGTYASALTSLILMLRPRYREEFATLSGWRFDPDLFRRLLRYGLPNGMQWALDALAFTVFTFIVGKFGKIELAATSVAFTINLVAILPMLGLGQAVSVLVGRRLGEDRPHLAERSAWTGFGLVWTYMAIMAALFLFAPNAFVYFFESHADLETWPQVAAIVPILMRFVAVYLMFDGINLVFSFALRGAGDTRFVTLLSLGLSWPIMVVPTWAAWHFGWGLYWAWAFATTYIIALAAVFVVRFRMGQWKSMRVIERVVPEPALIPAE